MTWTHRKKCRPMLDTAGLLLDEVFVLILNRSLVTSLSVRRAPPVCHVRMLGLGFGFSSGFGGTHTTSVITRATLCISE